MSEQEISGILATMADTANSISAPAVAVKTRSDLQDPSTQKSGRRQPSKTSKRERDSSSGSSPPKKRRQVAKQDMFRSHRFDSSVSSTPSVRRSSGRSDQDEDEITYTRTGRVSKAKKGKKVHLCDCGKVRIDPCIVTHRHTPAFNHPRMM